MVTVHSIFLNHHHFVVQFSNGHGIYKFEFEPYQQKFQDFFEDYLERTNTPKEVFLHKILQNLQQNLIKNGNKINVVGDEKEIIRHFIQDTAFNCCI